MGKNIVKGFKNHKFPDNFSTDATNLIKGICRKNQRNDCLCGQVGRKIWKRTNGSCRYRSIRWRSTSSKHRTSRQTHLSITLLQSYMLDLQKTCNMFQMTRVMTMGGTPIFSSSIAYTGAHANDTRNE